MISDLLPLTPSRMVVVLWSISLLDVGKITTDNRVILDSQRLNAEKPQSQSNLKQSTQKSLLIRNRHEKRSSKNK